MSSGEIRRLLVLFDEINPRRGIVWPLKRAMRLAQRRFNRGCRFSDPERPHVETGLGEDIRLDCVGWELALSGDPTNETGARATPFAAKAGDGGIGASHLLFPVADDRHGFRGNRFSDCTI